MSSAKPVNDDVQLDDDGNPIEGEGHINDEGQADSLSNKKVDNDADHKKQKTDEDLLKEKEEKEQLEHQKKVYDGMIESWISKIVMKKPNPNKDGQVYSIEDIQDEKMKEVVLNKIESVKVEGKASEETIVDKIIKEQEIKENFRILDEDQKSMARKDYDAFISKGDTHDNALTKTRKLYGLLTRSEQEEFEKSYGQRSHRVGASMKVEKISDEELKVANDFEREFGIKLKPENIKKAAEVLNQMK